MDEGRGADGDRILHVVVGAADSVGGAKGLEISISGTNAGWHSGTSGEDGREFPAARYWLWTQVTAHRRAG
ncbi:MAG TPA: hypothetical protein VMG31_16115 [Verrucomicrobiae bacterium]|nr:hypothetical protein [Verrucomicrobiae bacterium]